MQVAKCRVLVIVGSIIFVVLGLWFGVSAQGIMPIWDDSGCYQVYCLKSCHETDSGYYCETKALYERYDGEGDPQALRVYACAECDVVTLGEIISCSKTVSRTGSGRVYTWLSTVFGGVCFHRGGC